MPTTPLTRPLESRSKSISATEWRVSTPSFFASSASALTNALPVLPFTPSARA